MLSTCARSMELDELNTRPRKGAGLAEHNNASIPCNVTFH